MDYLKIIEERGFLVTRRNKHKELSDNILDRYKKIPTGYLDFLNQFEVIINNDDDVWFVSIEDFNEETETDFPWNAFELMSLEAFEEDKEESERIRDFWDNHIPILMSVREYEYLAICLVEDKFGEIVHGIEPEFEEVSKICNNFEELMDLMKDPSKNQLLVNFI